MVTYSSLVTRTTSASGQEHRVHGDDLNTDLSETLGKTTKDSHLTLEDVSKADRIPATTSP